MTQVILIEPVEKLGNVGEIVNVKAGYARNFLIPQKKALRTTKANIALFEAKKAEIEARNQKQKEQAVELSQKLQGQTFVLIYAASEKGHLYGSISAQNVVDTLKDKGFEITKSQVRITKPIKEVGIHPIRVVLHGDIAVEVNFNIAITEEVAHKQYLQAQKDSVEAAQKEEEKTLFEATKQKSQQEIEEEAAENYNQER